MIEPKIHLDGRRKAERFFLDAEKQVSFVLATAMTKSGNDIVKDQRKEMKRVFDRPTSYTINSVTSDRATKRKPESRVFVRRGRGEKEAMKSGGYLGPQIYGGKRRDKASERSLRQKGLLPAGYQTVPGSGLRLDRYGNIPGGRIAAILRNLGASRGKRAAKGTFVVGAVGTTEGIFQVTRRGWKPILIFVPRPTYNKRWDFDGITEKSFNHVWKKNMEQSWDSAMKTAK